MAEFGDPKLVLMVLENRDRRTPDGLLVRFRLAEFCSILVLDRVFPAVVSAAARLVGEELCWRRDGEVDDVLVTPLDLVPVE
jgi:hypothetical protein